MDSAITKEERKQIENSIKEKYAKVAVDPEAQFSYPTGKKGLEMLNYDSDLIEKPPMKSLLPTVA